MERKVEDPEPKRSLALKIGTAGGIIGTLSGLAQIVSGDDLSNLTGHKEDTFVLGLLTIILSGFAIFCTYRSVNERSRVIDRRVGWFLGISIPAILCFFTVGWIWIIAGLLLLSSVVILAVDLIKEVRETDRRILKVMPHWKRTVTLAGALVILIPVIFGGFTNSTELASFQHEGDSFKVKPMDKVQKEDYLGNITSSDVTGVMIVHIILLIGGLVAAISGQIGARIITISTGTTVLISLLFFFFLLPNVLFMEGAKMSQFDGDHFSSLSGGWYMAVFGSLLLLASQFLGSGGNKDKSSEEDTGP